MRLVVGTTTPTTKSWAWRFVGDGDVGSDGLGGRCRLTLASPHHQESWQTEQTEQQRGGGRDHVVVGGVMVVVLVLVLELELILELELGLSLLLLIEQGGVEVDGSLLLLGLVGRSGGSRGSVPRPVATAGAETAAAAKCRSA